MSYGDWWGTDGEPHPVHPLSSSALKWGLWEGSKVSRALRYPAGLHPQPTCYLPSVGGGHGVVFSKTTTGDSRHQIVSTHQKALVQGGNTGCASPSPVATLTSGPYCLLQGNLASTRGEGWRTRTALARLSHSRFCVQTGRHFPNVQAVGGGSEQGGSCVGCHPGSLQASSLQVLGQELSCPRGPGEGIGAGPQGA